MARVIQLGSEWGGNAHYLSDSYDPPHHPAVDVRHPTGSRVPALDDGMIESVRVDPSGKSGLFMVLLRADGWRNFYCHLGVTIKLPGAQVHRNDPIALSDNTGETTGPHTHVEEFSGTLGAKGHFRHPFATAGVAS